MVVFNPAWYTYWFTPPLGPVFSSVNGDGSPLIGRLGDSEAQTALCPGALYEQQRGVLLDPYREGAELTPVGETNSTSATRGVGAGAAREERGAEREKRAG